MGPGNGTGKWDREVGAGLTSAPGAGPYMNLPLRPPSKSVLKGNPRTDP